MSWTLQVLGNITLYDAAKTLKPERRMVPLGVLLSQMRNLKKDVTLQYPKRV
jgi:hypothetical protein